MPPRSRTGKFVRDAGYAIATVEKGWNIPKSSGEVALEYRQKPFETEAGVLLASSKVNANRIDAEGELRPKACVSCLKSMIHWKADKPVGRGVREYNELFSCRVLLELGSGQQCGRCIGLGQGSSCCDPPEQFAKHVKTVVEAASSYNKLLLEHAETTGEDLDDEETEMMEAARDASQRFANIFEGFVRQNPAAKSPTKKRLAKDAFSSDAIGTLGQASKDIRTDIRSLKKDARKAREENAELRRMLQVQIEMTAALQVRHIWLQDAVLEMVEHQKSTPEDPYSPQLVPLSLSAAEPLEPERVDLNMSFGTVEENDSLSSSDD